jgi:deoxyribodipyrimidine photo-lyase
MKRASRGTIVWFRQDLRLHDNPALHAGLNRGDWIIPLYIHYEPEEGDWPAGSASRWWLHQSLTVLATALRNRGSRLIVKRGPALEVLSRLAAQSGADVVYWNRRYEPAAIVRDTSLEQSLRKAGITCVSFNGSLLIEPWDLCNRSGGSYRVFTPFRRRLLECLEVPCALATPRSIARPTKWPESSEIAELQLLPTIRWYARMSQHWTPGELGALGRAREFLAEAFTTYRENRDQPAADGSSSLSPHLHFGELSVRQLWRLGEKAAKRQRLKDDAWRESSFASQLAWREFAHHLLYHYPRTATQPLDSRFERFHWQVDHSAQRAWERGLTGFPIVDAGMRQLWASGWMHNRARMIVASLLVKNLRQPWLQGARWFWDTLVDADLAANTLNWQWSAGCGADAAPYFRVFNPITQGKRFDPRGDYVRRWVPELARMPAEHIHAPHLAPAAVLQKARVRIGVTYPAPILDLRKSREQALAAYRALRRN